MQYVALASSQLHFMDTFNAGFLEEKKKNLFSISSLEASKPLHLFIETHQQNRYWYLIYMGFYLFCMVNRRAVPHSYARIYTWTAFYSTGQFLPQMRKEKKALAFSEIFD